MDRIGQLIRNLDQAELDGLSLDDESNRLRTAKYHKGAYDTFSKQLQSETDEFEQERLRKLVSFHSERLHVLLKD